MQIVDRVFLVTGGASGLGAATVRALVARGGRVMIADRASGPGQALAAELGPAAEFVSCDVTDPDSTQGAVDAALGAFGRLDGLVCCAGILRGERIVGREGPQDLVRFAEVIQVNLVGTFNALRLAAAAMLRHDANSEGERGVVVLTSSVAAFEGQIGQAAYSASKGGVASMVLPAARELAKHGIRVMAIAPGMFETPMMAATSAELRASLESQVPFPPRLGRPEEFAALVEHIVQNVMLNGEVIRLDGAVRMGPR